MSDTHNNNLNLSVAKTSTLSGLTLAAHNPSPKDYIAAHLTASGCSVLAQYWTDFKNWDNMVQVQKYQT